MEQKIGRNDPCPCGSGKKYKNCCINKPVSKPLPFKAKLLSQPKQVDFMSRTFGKQIADAEKLPNEFPDKNLESKPNDQV